MMTPIARRRPLLQAIALTLTILCAPVLGNAQVINNGFEIDGIAKGMPDGTLLYLRIARDTGGSIDSTYVLNERFRFAGRLVAPAEYALIRTQPLTDYKFVWLENTAMRFKGEKGSFRDAILTGSKSEDERRTLDSLLETVSESRRLDQYARFIAAHPNSIVSGQSLAVHASGFGRDQTRVLYDALSSDVKETSYGKTVSTFLSLNADPKIGDRFTDFAQPDVNGKPVSLSDFRGKVVLLEFWGSWCGPCRKSNPELVKVYHEFNASGFEVLGVASESNRNAWLHAIEKDKLPWTNVTELKGDKNNAAMIYGISYYPSNFLIDQGGTIIGKDISGNALRRMLKKHLGGRSK
jgi:thiol-disulfide isomerase/thioredoxin